jgi:hypothetical protein
MCCDQPYGLLGSVLETSIEEIWNSKLAQEIRKSCIAGTIHPKCDLQCCAYKYLYPKEHMKPVWDANHPISIEIDLPNFHCNINPPCMMCPRAIPIMVPDIDKLKEVCCTISPALSYLQTIHMQGLAESFYKNKIFEMLDWLNYDHYKINNKELTISTITNGLLFNKDTRDRLIKRCHKIDICFSMDAGSSGVYKTLRRSSYELARRNLMGYGQERDKSKHGLWINNNINIININDCVQMVWDAYESQADLVQFGPTDPFGSDSILVNRENCYLFEKAQEIIIETANTLGVKVHFRKPLHLNLRQSMSML